MGNTGTLQADPLFVGLTRPPMFLGVSIAFVMMYGLVTMLWFINSSDLRVFFVMPTCHLVGYIITFKEPLFMELILIKSQRFTKCSNRMYHGANSYDLY